MRLVPRIFRAVIVVGCWVLLLPACTGLALRAIRATATGMLCPCAALLADSPFALLLRLIVVCFQLIPLCLFESDLCRFLRFHLFLFAVFFELYRRLFYARFFLLFCRASFTQSA